MYQAALFDFDGTLVNTLADLAFCSQKAMEAVGLTAPNDEESYKKMVGNGADLLVRRILTAQHADDEETFQKAIAVFRQVYNEHPVLYSTVYDGMLPTLRELKQRGVKLGIVTNKPHATALLCTEKLFGNGLFDVCCGQKEGQPLKPDPTGAKSVLQAFGVAPSEAVYIGDTGVDMQTGTS